MANRSIWSSLDQRQLSKFQDAASSLNIHKFIILYTFHAIGQQKKNVEL